MRADLTAWKLLSWAIQLDHATGSCERSTDVQVIRMFLDLLVLSVDMLMAAVPTNRSLGLNWYESG